MPGAATDTARLDSLTSKTAPGAVARLPVTLQVTSELLSPASEIKKFQVDCAAAEVTAHRRNVPHVNLARFTFMVCCSCLTI